MFVAVLFSDVVVGVASDCASDPNQCTPKGLCEVATDVTDGNKLWSSEATSKKHIRLAKRARHELRCSGADGAL